MDLYGLISLLIDSRVNLRYGRCGNKCSGSLGNAWPGASTLGQSTIWVISALRWLRPTYAPMISPPRSTNSKQAEEGGSVPVGGQAWLERLRSISQNLLRVHAYKSLPNVECDSPGNMEHNTARLLDAPERKWKFMELFFLLTPVLHIFFSFVPPIIFCTDPPIPPSEVNCFPIIPSLSSGPPTLSAAPPSAPCSTPFYQHTANYL